MASIIKRQGRDGKTTYQVKIRLHGYPPQSATFDKLTRAKTWASSTESAIKEGRHFHDAEARRTTLAGVIDQYVEDILPELKTATDRERQLEWWKGELGALTLKDVTPALISRAKAKLAKETTQYGTLRTAGTVNRYLAALSHLFTIAVKEWQLISENPLLKITRPREPSGRTRYLSDEERTRLLETCRESESPYLYAAVVLSLSTGARRGKILGLRWSDVDLKEERLTLYDTKNGDIRLCLAKTLYGKRSLTVCPLRGLLMGHEKPPDYPIPQLPLRFKEPAKPDAGKRCPPPATRRAATSGQAPAAYRL